LTASPSAAQICSCQRDDIFGCHKDSNTLPQCFGTKLPMLKQRPKQFATSRICLLLASAFVVAAGPRAASAADTPPDNSTFGNRTDRPDGSSAVTIGRRLPTEWETKVGADFNLAAPPGTASVDNMTRASAERSTGAIWGNLSTAAVQPIGLDKASLEARVDAGSDEGKVGATVSRSVPLNPNVSVTLQNVYSVKQSLGSTPAGLPTGTALTTTTAAATTPASPWSMDETVRLSVNPFGTTISAGAGSSVGDSQWHNRLSVEQTLVGSLKMTTAVEDAGTAQPNKSISAGFKRTW
jgi:hypothetical protein